jgi:DNA polymerase-3 subunit epsilon
MKSYINLSTKGAQIIEKNKTTRRKKGNSILEFPEEFTVIDIETTGLDPSYDDIIELSAIKVVDGKETSIFTKLVNPGYPINSFITNLTGITNEMLEKSDAIEKILPQFLKFIGEDVVLGYNAHFDVNFIYDSTLEHLNTYFDNDIVDIYRFAKILIKDSKNYRLETIGNYFSIEYERLHHGLEDCRVTFVLYKEFKKLINERYGSEYEFLKRRKTRTKANDIATKNTQFDETHPVFEKNCVFTGTLKNMERKEGFQILKDLGGTPQDNVTKMTNYLILGETDYTKVKDGKSAKLKKAERYQLEGLDIQIISEQVFYDMISS